MSFKNSLIISAVFHGLILFLAPYPWETLKKPRWVEVSLTAFPNITSKTPDYAEGRPKIPEPALREPELSRSDIPFTARDYDTGKSVEQVSPDRPAIVKEGRSLSIKKDSEKIIPGRIESSGLSEGPGKDDERIIAGPVSRRRLLTPNIYPEYPAWAEEKGVEGEVKLKFWVTPGGVVENVEVVKTSGYPDFDSRALRAVNRYRFSPLSSQEEQENQWGTIVIKYTLR